MFQSSAAVGFSSVYGNGAGENDSSDENILAPPIYDEVDEILERPVYASPLSDPTAPSTSAASGADTPAPAATGVRAVEALAESGRVAVDRPQSPRLTLAGAQRMYYLILRNVVAKFQVNRHVDLRALAHVSGNVVYRKSAGRAKLQFRRPRCWVHVSMKGDVLITSAKSEDETRWAAVKVGRAVLRSSPAETRPLRFLNFAVCNIMATAYLPYGVKLPEMKTGCGDVSMVYEPELSPALQWRFTDPSFSRAVANVFTTGSVVITGVSSVDGLLRVLETVAQVTSRYVDPTRPKNAKILTVDKSLFQDIYGDDELGDDEQSDTAEIDVLGDENVQPNRRKLPPKVGKQFDEWTRDDQWSLSAGDMAAAQDDRDDDELDETLDRRKVNNDRPPPQFATQPATTAPTAAAACIAPVQATTNQNLQVDEDDDDDFEDVS